MTDYQPTLEDRVDDRERVKINVSKSSYLSILFAVEGVAKELVSDLVVIVGAKEAEHKLEAINDLTVSLAEFALNHTEYKSK